MCACVCVSVCVCGRTLAVVVLGVWTLSPGTRSVLGTLDSFQQCFLFPFFLYLRSPTPGPRVSPARSPKSANCEHPSVQPWPTRCAAIANSLLSLNVSPSLQGGWVGASQRDCPAGRGCVPGCGRQGAAGGSRGRPSVGRRGGEPRRAETLNRLHFPQILPFLSSPRPAGRQLPPPSARPLSAPLCLRGPPAARFQKFDHLSFLPLLLRPFRWKQKSEAGASAAPDSWDHGPGAGARGAPAALPACSGAPRRRAALRERGPRALSRPGEAARGAGGPMGRAHSCPPGSGA